MYKKLFFTITFTLAVYITSSAQKITISMLQEANQPYVFVLNQGLTLDTIQNGRLNFAGNTVIDIPETYKDYIGVGIFSIKDKQSIFLIVNHEDFEMNINNARPKFINSAENNYLYDSLFGNEPKINDTTLYAPHFLTFLRFIQQQNQVLQSGNDLMRKLQTRQYATDQLDFDRLYTSGLWFFAIDNLMKMESNQTMMGEDFIKILKRIRSPKVFESLSKNLVTIMEQYGLEDAFEITVPFIQNSGRIEVPKGKLFDAFQKAKFRKGMIAPTLEGRKNELKETALKKTIVIFYDPECHNCEAQLEQLSANYKKLLDQGIQIISVSSADDMSKDNLDKKRFPWKNKLCDFKGFVGNNFKNYGVISTPTLFLLDNEDKLIGRYALFSEMKLM